MNKLLIFMLLCLFSVCQNPETVYDKNKETVFTFANGGRETYMYGDEGNHYNYYEYIIIDNAPKSKPGNKDLLKRLMILHYLQLTSSADSLSVYSDLDAAGCVFLRSTRSTREYYIEGKIHYYSKTQAVDHETYVGIIRMDRCEYDNTKRMVTISVHLGTESIEFKERGPNLETDTLLNECSSSWYVRNKDNELVKYFMELRDGKN